MADPKQRPIEIDHVIIKCPCGKERRQDFMPFLVGAEAFMEWMKTIGPCGCGAAKCDVAAHLVGSDAGPD